MARSIPATVRAVKTNERSISNAFPTSSPVRGAGSYAETVIQDTATLAARRSDEIMNVEDGRRWHPSVRLVPVSDRVGKIELCFGRLSVEVLVGSVAFVFRRMDDAFDMFGRAVDRVEPEGLVARIPDIVSRARRHDHRHVRPY